jgi:hypothetical protein
MQWETSLNQRKRLQSHPQQAHPSLCQLAAPEVGRAAQPPLVVAAARCLIEGFCGEETWREARRGRGGARLRWTVQAKVDEAPGGFDGSAGAGSGLRWAEAGRFLTMRCGGMMWATGTAFRCRTGTLVGRSLGRGST